MKPNIYKLLIIIIIQFGYTVKLLSQHSFFTTDLQNYRFVPQSIGNSAPETAAFAKYGNLDINHYNGLFEFQVPIYEYKDRDFNIPIIIKYVSEMFKPQQRSGIIGQNWTLVVGGIVSRTVKGAPDDLEGYYSTYDNYYRPAGLLSAARNSSMTKYTKSELINLQWNGNWRSIRYDLEPDIFKFNFADISGGFIIDHTGKPILIDAPGCKIDISELTIQKHSLSEAPVPSKIKITAPNGYIYEFGGNIDYLEYIIPHYPSNYLAKIKVNPRQITSWYLNSVKAPNGRVVKYSYNTSSIRFNYSYYVKSSALENPASTSGYYMYKYKDGYTKYESNSRYGSSQSSFDEETLQFKDKIFKPVIKQIQIDYTNVSFAGEEKYSSFYGDNDGTDKVLSLNSIQVTNSGNLLHDTSFGYLNKGKYFLLDNINTQGQKYNFKYHDLPIGNDIPNTSNTDHWGGWTGINGTTGKAVNTEVHNTGLLNKIQYPTGGETLIEYEYNRYNYISDTYSDVTKPSGGSRVAVVKDYNPTTSKYYNIRKYEYIDPLSKKGSGAINKETSYYLNESFTLILSERIVGRPNSFNISDTEPTEITIDCSTRKNVSYSSTSMRNIGNLSILDACHIGYSDVVESYEDGSYTHYKYSSHQNTPDNEKGKYSVNSSFDENRLKDSRKDFESAIDKLYNYTYTRTFLSISTALRSLTVDELADKYGLLIKNDMSRFRGKLLEKKMYSKDKIIISTEKYTYNIDEVKNNFETMISVNSMGSVKNNIYVTPYRLIQKQTIDKNNVSITERFEYNNKGFISKIGVDNSNSVPHSFLFRYPTDEISSTDQCITTLILRNIINTPILIYKTVGNDNSNIYSAVKTDFKNEHNLILKHNTYYLEITNPVSTSNLNSHFSVRESYHNYDSRGNPLYISKDDAEKTVYLWGYNYQYPIAEIKNATYSQVLDAIPGRESTINSLASSTNPDMNIVNNLRQSLSNALVTTYTHKPLVGISTIIDPRGVETTYEYDGYGRLKLIKDMNGSIIESYDYHYQNQ